MNGKRQQVYFEILLEVYAFSNLFYKGFNVMFYGLSLRLLIDTRNLSFIYYNLYFKFGLVGHELLSIKKHKCFLIY